MSEIHLYDVIVRPVVTEKSTREAAENNVYAFEVDVRANKPLIKEAVEAVFNVNVLKVRTMMMPAKYGRRLRKRYIRTSAWKKALVTVAAGQKIDLFGA